ncbi:hypothetical protein BGW36DRAFT_380821 [Talaromyces proteolyticus]|uniref:Uncharacterized protein n=1 Tax=Talaromyces proteolyticus TaxID=1131652 RepID=A0AAD4KPA7_9EURO|nr:uncharacterized protein BGW36DRAFT_380821 [Talaromyces proteolyticus]KAH8696369.1 hypothetical protein BGW36DRAFT_380821 [Talaromyces proteolyticus]
MPREISEALVDTLLDFSRRVQKAPTTETLAQRLIRMESYMEKTQKEVSQTSREVLNTKSNTNRLLEALCTPSPSGARQSKISAGDIDL